MSYIFNPFTNNLDYYVPPAGATGTLQFNAGGNTFGAVTGSSVSGGNITLATTATFKAGNLQLSGTTLSATGILSTIISSPNNLYLRPGVAGEIFADTGVNHNFSPTGNFNINSGATFNVNASGGISLSALAGNSISCSGDTVDLSNVGLGNHIGIDAAGGVTMRATGDQGGVYADPSGYTYVGYYSNATHITVDPTGNIQSASGLPQMGGDPGSGANGWVSTSNVGGGLFFDFVSGGDTDYSALRISQYGVGSGLEFGVCGADGQFHSDALMGDAVFKGNVGGSNNFRFGPGSGGSGLAILANNNVLINGATSVGYGVLQVTGAQYISSALAIGTTTQGGSKLRVVGGAIAGDMDTMTYSGTISLDVTKGNLHKTTTVNATGNATINASAVGIAGQHMWVQVLNDATSGKVITFGTNFKTTGTVTGTVSKSALLHFVSDGINWYEVSRTLAL